MIILAVLAFTKTVNTFFPGLWSKLMCIFKCCEKQIQRIKEEKYQMDTEKAYSNNIYREMTIDDLRREFQKTQTEANDYKALLEAAAIRKETKAVQYLVKKYDAKLLTIKEMLNKWLKQAYINEVVDINDAFDKLFRIRKSDPSHRLKTLYSYDIRDNTLFKKTQKIEEKLRAKYAQMAANTP
jgi:nitrogen fixation/metabolism regulation signal transduction histidine kinase